MSPLNTLSSVWAEHKAVTLERVTLVDNAVERLLAGELTDRDRECARRAAHMLAGTVGMFGFERSSEAARALEEAFEAGITPDRSEGRTLRERVATMRTEGLEPRLICDPLPGITGLT
ncbi:MAG TPA: Hpt domain-containing protein [Solirubrobacteraceae bacterium]